jgi:hypothetical protein
MRLIIALFIALMVCSAAHAKPIRSQRGKVIAKEPYRAERVRKNFSDQRQKKSVVIKRRRGNIGTIPRAQKKKIKKPIVKKKTTKTNEHNRLLLLWIQDVLRGQ